MQESIIEYVKEYGEYGFGKRQFTEVDALVLSQFVYLNLEGHIGRLTDDRPGVILRKLAQDVSIGKEEKKSAKESGSCDQSGGFFDNVWYEKDNRQLFEAMAKSRRFGGMELNYYAGILSEEAQTQFSAVTVFLEEGPAVVLFRGTDTTLIGWKEDFNMAFRRPVTGHRLSTMYLNQVGYRIPGAFLVSGHSKGGNFAVYGAMSCVADVKERIHAVYSFDGPGFRPEILDSADFEAIRVRIFKYLPQSSVVGMLLQTREDYRVVECTGVGLMQHNPFTWKVREGHFVEAEDIVGSTKLMNATLNDWIFSREDAQLEVFIESLYQVITAANAKTLMELIREPGKNFSGMLEAFRDMDEETKEKLKEILLALWEAGAQNLFHSGK